MDLPRELKIEILGYLKIKHLRVVRDVCKELRMISDGSDLWNTKTRPRLDKQLEAAIDEVRRQFGYPPVKLITKSSCNKGWWVGFD